jgi:sulfur-oxidizing protein SoxX
MKNIVIAAGLLAFGGSAFAQDIPKANPAIVEKYVESMWSKASPEWQARVKLDETQRICSQTNNTPSQAEFDAILAREKASVVYPADGNVMGDWKRGMVVAQRGTGGQFSDAPGTYQGGNCFACHELTKEEVSYGTLGPSLLGYGKTRKFEPAEAKAAFAKIYNPHAVFPCSQMPRFGYTKFLTEEQIKDAVALLFSPDSPVNK